MKNILTADALAFFEQYINTSSPSGFESAGQKVWSDYLRPYVDTLEMDNYGNTWGVINPDAEYKVVIEAHADEIGWAVKYIDDKGLLYLCQVGGADTEILPSRRMVVHTRDGKQHDGVVAWPAIHIRSKDKPSKIKAELGQVFVDIGAKNKEEVENMGIHAGCLVTHPDPFTTVGDYFVGRAMDNRAGGFMIAQVARLLQENKKKLPFGLYIVNAVQEEVGVHGAAMVARKLQPDVAIVTDVNHCTTTPGIDNKKHGSIKSGDGPTVMYGPTVHQKLVDIVTDTAKKNKIPYQTEMRSRGGWNVSGTDTDAFAYHSNGGVACLLSLPLRYMHTPSEMIHKSDVKNTIQLMYETLLALNPATDYRYLAL